MKKSNQLVKLGLVALMASMYSTSASADVISGNATATVIAPLILIEVTPMSFGTIAGGSTAGSVAMDLLGNRVASGGATALASAPGAAGAFTIQGASAVAFTLTLTTDAVLDDGAGNTMGMTAASLLENANLLALDGTVQAFQISGTLTVGANQVAGAYTTATGTPFTVTANYN